MNIWGVGYHPTVSNSPALEVERLVRMKIILAAHGKVEVVELPETTDLNFLYSYLEEASLPGRVSVNGKEVKSADVLKDGDVVFILPKNSRLNIEGGS